MADFYVPIATGLFTDLNDKIAAGPPKPDMSFISNALENYDQGGKIKQDIGLRNVFQDGYDPATAAQKLLQVGGASQIPNAMSLQKFGIANQLLGNNSPVSAPPSSATAIPSNGYGQRIASAANGTGIDSGMLARQLNAESGFDPNAVSSKGATGIAQFMPGTAKQYGVNPTDPNSSIDGAARYDADLLKKYNGNQALALAAYNWGPGNVDKWLQSGGDISQMPRETQAYVARITGQPITQAFSGQAQGQAAPQGQLQQAPQVAPTMTEATAARYEQAANAAYQKAQAASLVDPSMSAAFKAQGDAYMNQASIIRKTIGKNSEQTPEQKNSADPNAPNYASTVETNKQDTDTFQKRYTGLQAAGEQSYNGQQKVQLMKQLTMQPAFYSGPLHEGVQTFNQFKSIFGSNPSSALPQEAFNKVANDLLQEQVKAMGQSGVGRVLQSEVNIMKQSIASLGITPQSNRALAEILNRVYQQNQDIAGIARNVNAPPGQKNRALDAAVSDYLKQHPLFTQQEIQHPETLGAPDAPPQSAQWSPQQKRQWAQGVGLKPGDPIRFNGQVVSVP